MSERFIKELAEMFKKQYKYSIADMIKNNDLEQMLELDVKQVAKIIKKEFEEVKQI